MNPVEQEWMERYVYAVTRRLPKSQRQEVARELEELIGDMLEDGGTMESVLARLGDPAEFAKKYQDGARYLIGPAYFENYVWLLRIVLICTAAASLAAGAIEGVRGAAALEGVMQAGVTAAVQGVAGGLAEAFAACLGAFGAVTLIFALMERHRVRFESGRRRNAAAWTPAALEAVPHKKAEISRGDNIVGIVFIVIFCVLLIFTPSVFSAMRWNGEVMQAVPVFNLAQWHKILPVFVLSLAVGLIDEVVQLAAGRYGRPVMVSSIVCGAVQLVLSYIVLKVFPVWNPNFAAELQDLLGAAPQWTAYWNGDAASSILFGLCVLATCLEVGTAVYKSLRYGAAPAEKSAAR